MADPAQVALVTLPKFNPAPPTIPTRFDPAVVWLATVMLVAAP